MKRIDLTTAMLERIMKETKEDVEAKIKELLSLSDSTTNLSSTGVTPFTPVLQILKYASADQTLMLPYSIDDEISYNPNDDIIELLNALFLPAIRHQQKADIPTWFWDTPLGYVCDIASARHSLDSFMPLTVMQLAVLADRKHTTVQQHCQRGSIKAVKDKKAWKIPPHVALDYLKSVQSEPFLSNYNPGQYKTALENWLKTGIGSFIDKDEIEKFYGDLLD